MINKSGGDQVASKKDVHDLRDELKTEIHGLRSDLKKAEKSLRGEVLRVEERVENIEGSQTRVEATLNKISTQLDGFIGRVDDLTTENTIGASQIHKLQEDVVQHDKRLIALESARTTG